MPNLLYPNKIHHLVMPIQEDTFYFATFPEVTIFKSQNLEMHHKIPSILESPGNSYRYNFYCLTTMNRPKYRVSFETL